MKRFELENTFRYKKLQMCFSPDQIRRGIKYYRTQLGYDKLSDFDAVQMMYEIMCKNPYELIEIPYFTLQFIDKRVTTLPEVHQWHINYFDSKRFMAMVGSALRQYIRQGTAVLGKQHVVDLVMNIFSDNTPEQYLTENNRRRILKLLDETSLYQNVELMVDGHMHKGVISSEYLDQTKQLAQGLLYYAYNEPTDLDETCLTNALQGVTDNDGNHIELSEEQQTAVRNLLSRSMSVLTGYAGVGKSTLIQAVTNYIAAMGQTAQLCAHAGKAAFNLEQMTGTPARTIASLLYSNQSLKVNYLIVDEISMVSETSLLKLLKLCSPVTHIILVGDRAQLPAVEGVGVLTSLLMFLDANDDIYTKNLTHVYRQAHQSQLLQMATQIRNHQTPTDFESHDESLIVRQGTRQLVLNAYKEAVVKYGSDNVNVITPLNRDVAWFNQQLQQHTRENNKGVCLNNRWFYINDKVLVTKNMYGVDCSIKADAQIDLFNGFVGKVVDIVNYDGRLGIVVRFPSIQIGEQDSQVEFFETATASGNLPQPHERCNAEVQNLELGYALTVHKSQGSTIPIVIYYLDSSTPPFMLTNELLYTALTRAKDRLLFITNQPISPNMLRPFVHATAYASKTSYLSVVLTQQKQCIKNELSGILTQQKHVHDV